MVLLDKAPVRWTIIAYGTPVTCHRSRAADLNHDGHADLAVIGETHVLVYDGSVMNRETGYTVDAIPLELACEGRYLEIADMNGDNAPDIVTVGRQDGIITQIFWNVPGNNEGISFEPGIPTRSEAVTRGAVLVVGDLNDDGAVDFVLAEEAGEDPVGQVYLNDARCQPGTTEPGDANADSAVNMADAVAILSYLFRQQPLPCLAAAEVNGDGTVNLADPLYILQYLFVDGPAIVAALWHVCP